MRLMPLMQSDGCDQGFYWQPEHDSAIGLVKQKGELQLQFPLLDFLMMRLGQWLIWLILIQPSWLPGFQMPELFFGR